MRINSGYVGMESERRYTTTASRTLKFNAIMVKGQLKDKTKQDGLKQENRNRNSGGTNNNMGLSEKFLQVNSVNVRKYNNTQETFEKIRDNCIRNLIQLLVGGGFRQNSLNESMQNSVKISGKGMEEQYIQYSKEEEFYYKETENTTFSTTGKVITTDGREMSFQVNLEMSRSFESYYKQRKEWTVPAFTDPLVINLDTNMAEVSDQTFLFDLDADGEKEEISMLEASSGYLALDQNNDGTINDGNELFGTKSGNGFADLEKYDMDGNGWIDENDPIFDKLKIWCKDEKGKDLLYALKDKGVGAICLQNVVTDFSLKNKQNETNAAIRNTGIFLYENGTAGTVQHLDLAN